MHARAAAALEPLARHAPERGGEVAAHLLRAAPDRAALRRAADWAAAAAAAATSALAFEDAARYLATALAAAEAAGVRRHRTRGAADRAGHRGVPGRPALREPAARRHRRRCRRTGRAA